jgi:adenylate kinase family enzyme
MKILIIGASGSGKTTIASFISRYLDLLHIECDVYFNEGLDIRERVTEDVKLQDWIIDGHLSKIHDVVIPQADKFIVIQDLNLRSLFRTIKRDWLNPKRVFFTVLNYERTSVKRQEILDQLLSTRKEDVIFLENFPNLSETRLAIFCEDMKTSFIKSSESSV